MRPDLVKISKFLSLVLRHRPETIGLTLAPDGWVAVDELLAACRAHGRAISRAVLDEVVATNDKRRFAFSPDGTQIRANQGHSVEVDLGLAPVEPPELLYHGTVARFLDSIRRQGLLKGQRRHVHLSADRATAEKVGQRRGRPVVLEVEAGRLHRDGHPFYLSENGVWLVEAVPSEYLRLPGDQVSPSENRMNKKSKPRVLHQGRYLQFVDRGGWEYVRRTGVSGVVVIVAVTDRREMVLVEQYRPALDARVLDMPAGLAGDRPGEEHEDLAEAARRELLEEAGFEAQSLEPLTEGPASAGSSAEVLTLMLARGCRRVDSGGGDESEDIQVHVVPLDGIEAWLEARRKSGVLLDPKVYAGLYFVQARL